MLFIAAFLQREISGYARLRARGFTRLTGCRASSLGHPIDDIEQISSRATETAWREARERVKTRDFVCSRSAPQSP
jgi:hypothetical protein